MSGIREDQEARQAWRKENIYNKVSVNQPAMTMRTRCNETKILPCEIIGALYHVDPKNWREAMNSDKFVEWERAAESKLDSLKANDTWEMVFARMKCTLFTQRGFSRQKQMLTETSSATKHG